MLGMFGVFSTALMGIVIGAAGHAVMPRRHSGGLITTVALGVCGSNLGASLGWLNGVWNVGDAIGYAAGAGTALIFLFVYRLFATPAAH